MRSHAIVLFLSLMCQPLFNPYLLIVSSFDLTHPTFPYSLTFSSSGHFAFPSLVSIHGLCAVPALNQFLYIVVAYCLYSPRLCQLRFFPHSARTPLIAGVDTYPELPPTFSTCSPLQHNPSSSSTRPGDSRSLRQTSVIVSRSKRSDHRHPNKHPRLTRRPKTGDQASSEIEVGPDNSFSLHKTIWIDRRIELPHRLLL